MSAHAYLRDYGYSSQGSHVKLAMPRQRECQVEKWDIRVGRRPEGRSIEMPAMELKLMESRKD